MSRHLFTLIYALSSTCGWDYGDRTASIRMTRLPTNQQPPPAFPAWDCAQDIEFSLPALGKNSPRRIRTFRKHNFLVIVWEGGPPHQCTTLKVPCVWSCDATDMSAKTVLQNPSWQTSHPHVSTALLVLVSRDFKVFLPTQDSITIQCHLHHAVLVEHHLSHLIEFVLNYNWIDQRNNLKKNLNLIRSTMMNRK